MKVIQILTPVAWAAVAAWLRTRELQGTIPGYLLPLVLVLAAASVICLAMKAPGQCEACRLDFKSMVPFSLLFLGSIILVGASVMRFAQEKNNYLLLLEAVSGTILLIHALAERTDKHLPPDILLVPVVAQVVRLIFTYREDAANPDLSAYYIGMLAVAAAVLGLLYFASYYFDLAKPRALTAVCAVTVVLCVCDAAQWNTPLTALLPIAWALVFFAVLAAFRKEGGDN